ncbi:MAG: hypothetical protein CMD31_13010 [Flavobacteriales bacterium]|jgi:hypothetical protein|nr:hypothetical protein [Flavobacteriales bacterium]|tara:strand:- start:29798 stop:30214 length:417 start_codon:yes stop_codon:yes gene_type:complete
MKNNPYPHQNFASTEDYLEELILWTSGERGRIPIDENNGGYEDLNVNDSEAKVLKVPQDAISATISFEVDASVTNKTRALRYKKNGTAPTPISGQAFGDGDVLELFGKTSLTNFKVIGIEEGKIHTLRVQYYKTAQIQ